MSTQPVAELRGASKRYKTGDQVITALHPTDFQLFANQLTLIIGPSGVFWVRTAGAVWKMAAFCAPPA